MTPQTPFDLELIQDTGAVLLHQTHHVSCLITFKKAVTVSALTVDVYLIKIKVRKHNGAWFVMPRLAVIAVYDGFIAGNALSDPVLVRIPEADERVEDPAELGF